MEVHLTPDQEARLSEIAMRAGKNAEQVVQDTIARMLENQARFIEAVKQGIASADRGDFVEHDEVVERVEGILRS